MRPLRLGTRGSQLALWQARTVAHLVEQHGTAVEIVTIKTSGDRLQDAALTDAGGKRLFVKEIEDALLDRTIDLAVHSAKDMPAVLPDGLSVAAVLPREDPRDALLLPGGRTAEHVGAAQAMLGQNPSIGTSSVRRIAQLAMMLPHARFAPIRGNVDTRLRKLDEGGYHALVLAVAGLKRLGFDARVSLAIPVADCIPAPGQGIVAIEIRADDAETREAVAAVNDASASQSLDAERALVNTLGGGCQLPLGAIALHVDEDLEMHAVVASVDGTRIVKRSDRGPASQPTALGRRLADELVRGGALEILDQVRSAQGPIEGSH